MSVYTSLSQDQRLDFLMTAESMGAIDPDSASLSSSGCFVLWIPPCREPGETLHAIRDRCDTLAAKFGMVRKDWHLTCREGSDDPAKCWYGPHNLPPDKPAYRALAFYGMP